MKLEPTDEQREVMKAAEGPLRVAAGAGTGKTTTIALRVLELIRRGALEPEQVLGLTFTNKAAEEMATRLRELLTGLSEPGREVEIHTYHGFAAQILGEFGALVGIERRTKVITPAFSRQLLYEVVRTHELPGVDVTRPTTVEELLRLGSALGDHLLEPDDIEPPVGAGDPWRERAGLLVGLRHYRERKRRLGVADFSDLVAAAHRLLAVHPDVAATIARRYRAVLLDEYQDTNPAQRLMLQALFGPGHPVTAVGDPDQTIYEWRGASLDNFEAFPDHFPLRKGGRAPTLPLTHNRRSGTRILAVANAVRERIGSGSAGLVARKGAPPGRVTAAWFRTGMEEADWIAGRLLELHDRFAWREMAVLFRKNKDIPLVLETLGGHDIPVEVANLGGLLAIPEVTDLYSWLRLLEHPGDGPAVARVLLGSAYRLGLADLATLGRWVRRHNPPEDEDPETGLSLLEAVDRLEEVEGLRPAAATALGSFRATYRRLLEAAQGSSLVELCRQVLDITGAWPNVDALPEASRLSARLNLYRFLDLAEDWSPLEGRPSLAAFLGFLSASAETDADELDPARLSGQDAVALLTVHRAKGLEWEAVFLPAVYEGNFPSGQRRSDDPTRFAVSLPYELRLDRHRHPAPETDPKELASLLRQSHEQQEWRVAYVAATRPRSALTVTGAYWYGSPEPRVKPAEPGPLYELVAGHSATEVLHAEPAPGDRPALLRSEPEAPAPDPLFGGGWEEALRSAVGDPGVPRRLAAELGLETEYDRRLQEGQLALLSLPGPEPPPDALPVEISVTGLVTYASCPLRYRWSEIDHLPRRPSPAAQRGIEIHRRIELHNRGNVSLEEVGPELFDLPEHGEVASADPMSVFRASRFAALRPLLVEAPFELMLGGARVRGRIDAIYADDTGVWEVVDFKTGSPGEDDSAIVQLQAYALGVTEVPFRPEPPDRVRVTFAHLGGGLIEIGGDVDGPWLERARARLEELVAGIVSEAFGPRPGPGCRSCDFARFCPEGTAYLSVLA